MRPRACLTKWCCSRSWGKKRVLLIGYSFGADVLPFLVSRLSAASRARVAGVTVPEVDRLNAPVTCVFGADESDSACRSLKGLEHPMAFNSAPHAAMRGIEFRRSSSGRGQVRAEAVCECEGGLAVPDLKAAPRTLGALAAFVNGGAYEFLDETLHGPTHRRMFPGQGR